MSNNSLSPKISVLIPTYNAEHYIADCLDSLLNQTYADFEALIINDGSVDNTKSICEKYCNQYSNFHLINQENLGVDKARNIGLSLAKGNYITFMDADDWVGQDWLEIYMNGQARFPSCDLFVQGIIVDYITSSRIECLPQNFYVEQDIIKGITALEISSMSGFTPNKMYKRSIITENNLFFKFTLKEDLLFNLKYFNHINSLFIISKASYHYVQRNTPSLIKKRYPAQYMLSLSGELRNAGLNIAERYTNRTYKQFVEERFFNDYSALIASLYRKPYNIYSKKIRYGLIKDYKKEIKKLKVKKKQHIFILENFYISCFFL